jgi:hypothetical protein
VIEITNLIIDEDDGDRWSTLKRTATTYCNVDSPAKGYWPLVGEEDGFMEACAQNHGFLP